MEHIHNLINQATVPKPSYTMHVWEKDNSMVFKTDSKPPEGAEPYLLYLPKEKVTAFLKAYSDFVVNG